MDFSTVVSKRKKRIIGVSYDEIGLPHVEEIVNGKRLNISQNLHSERSLMRLPFSVKFLHRSFIARNFFTIFPNFQKLPEKYAEYKEKPVNKIKVKKLIIGGGTAGIISLDNESILISRDVFGDIIYDTSPIPEMDKKELISKLKEKVKEFDDRILIGNFLGKFDEGYLFETQDKFLLLEAQLIILSAGGRTLRPIFKNNFLPRIVSREYYLRRFKNKTNIVVLGFSDTAIQTALNSPQKSTIIYPKGVKPVFTKFYLDLAKDKGISILESNIHNVKFDKEKMIVETDEGEIKTELIVFSVIKQPRIEISYNVGLDYYFNQTLHIYLPTSSDKIKAIGGINGRLNDYTSYLEGLGNVDEIKKYEYHDEFIQQKSPYLYSDEGIVCECEDLDLEDIKFAQNLGFNNVEDIKRVTGLGTGHCQGKVCSYITGSLTKSEKLISFRSPLYPVIL